VHDAGVKEHVHEQAEAARTAEPFRVRRHGQDRRSRRTDNETNVIEAEISPVWENITPTRSRPATNRFLVTQSRDALLRRSLAVVDVLGAYFGLLVAVLVIGHGAIHPRSAAVLIGPFVVLTSKAIGLYDRDENTMRKTTIDELPSILYLSVFYTLAVWLAEAVLLDGWLTRPQVFGLAVATLGSITLGRAVARHCVLAITASERCAILGNAAEATKTAGKLNGSPGVKATVVGRIALGPGDGVSPDGTPPLGSIGAIGRLIDDHDIERVIIAPDGHDQDEVLNAIRLVKALGVKVSVLPRLLEVVGSSSTFDEVDGITLLGIPQDGLSKSSMLLKRLMDFAVASLLLVLLAPLFLVLTIAIKLDTRGPVFFRQRRIGRSGTRFQMFKFRSMVQDAEQIKDRLLGHNEAEGGLFKITEDPRITFTGRFLRKTSIDELPQLVNVLLGHMSLVGPRPLVPDEDVLIEGWERRRLAVQPGMTGLWQIFGSSRIPMHDMVKIDYLYGANWSIWLDLKILMRTVPYVLKRRGL
jgi:exopolysaccharide biosynthesis polyprenyl glycosylphosphotransferase